MIGRLVGKVIETQDATVLLDVGGVGYEVSIPVGTLGRLATSRPLAPTSGNQLVALSIHTHVREDTLDLFGFASEVERRVFRLLIAVPNVGPKMAVNILGILPPAELGEAIAREDLAALQRVSGVGKKKAELILLQLREALPAVGHLGQEQAPSPASATSDAERLAGALTNMGYRPQQADRAVAAVKGRLGKEPLASLLKAALAELA